MKVQFIGVGEAFDPTYSNSSFLVHSDTKLMIDCGYAVPLNFFDLKLGSDFVDSIYLTHFHADHFFGLPPLLLRWRDDGRVKPLTIIGQPGVAHVVQKIVEFAYRGNFAKISFPLHFMEIDSSVILNEFTLTFAETQHGVRNFAVRIQGHQSSVTFSGDGFMTDESRALAISSDYLVHEAFAFNVHRDGHTSAMELMEALGQGNSLRTVALVHISRNERATRLNDFTALNGKFPFAVQVPLPGDYLKT